MTELLIAKVERRPPRYMPLAKIRESAGSESGPSGVYAYVEPNFSFENWREPAWVMCDKAKKLWKFQGSNLVLKVEPQVFLPEEFKQSRAVLEPIVRHEELHVGDAERIVRESLPRALHAMWDFKRLFLEADPVPNEIFEEKIKYELIDELVKKEFATFWDPMVDQRDSKAAYHSVAAAVQAALARESNRKLR